MYALFLRWSLVFLVCFVSSRCMIAGVPVGLVFPGSVETCGYGKAGVIGTFFLIQVYDRRCSWFQSFPFHDQLRPVAMVKPVFPVRSSSSRCMIAGVPGSSLSLSMISWGRWPWQSRRSWCVLLHPGVWSPVFLVAPVFPFPWSVEAGGYGKAGVPGAFFLIQVYDRHLFLCNRFSCLEWFI